jgi:CTP:molybdopterin cytidylyltransferase MocA
MPGRPTLGPPTLGQARGVADFPASGREGACASGIVLAAGSGSRLGQPKADLVLDGTRLLDRAIATLRAGGCTEVIAVVRPGTRADDATVVENPKPERGVGSSLRIGLNAATGDVAVIMLVDTPGIGPAAVRQLLAEGAPVAVATYAGRRGHPVAIARAYWPQVAALADADYGARRFLTAYPELVIEVPCVGDPVDLDTAADVAAWHARS